MYKFNKMRIAIRFSGSLLVLAILLQARSVSPQVCSGTRYLFALDHQNKILTSPGYPSQYANDLDCTWIISASSGKYVKITFTTFQTETNYDYVEIRDGQYSYSSLLAKYNGTKSAFSFFVSSGTKLRIRFKTDGSETGKGFRAFYRAFDTPATTLPNVRPTTRYYSNMCNGTRYLFAFDHQDKIITSPGYPSQYANDLDCTWIISASSGKYVKITFATFQTETIYDYVEIRDGQYSYSSLLAKYSGTKSAFSFFVSSGPKLRIRFKTDGSETSKGFRAFYRAFDTPATTLPNVRPTTRYYSNKEEELTIALSTVSVLFFVTLIVSLSCWRELRKRQRTSTVSQRPAGVEFQPQRVELVSLPEQNEVSATAPIGRLRAEETGNRVTEPSATPMSIPDEPPPTYLQAVGQSRI